MSDTLLSVVTAADNFPSFSTSYPLSHPGTNERYVPFHLTFKDYEAGLPAIGLLRPQVLHDLLYPSPLPPPTSLSATPSDTPSATGTEGEVEEKSESPWQAFSTGESDGEGAYELEVQCVFLADWVLQSGKQGISKVFKTLLGRFNTEGKYRDCLDGEHSLLSAFARIHEYSTNGTNGTLIGWRNELYAVYASPESSFFTDKRGEPFSNHAFDCERSACAIFGFCTFGVHMTGKSIVLTLHK